MIHRASIALALVFCALSPAFASTRHVPSTYQTIERAVNAAVDGDTVLVAAGLYSGPGNRDIDPHGRRLRFVSESGPEATIIDCGGSPSDPHTGFIIGSMESALLDGFTVRNGWYYSGGAVFLGPAIVDIRNCIFQQNEAAEGGAVYAGAAYVEMKHCLLVDNRSETGGAVHMYGSDVRLDNCTLARNIATTGNGSAVYMWFSQYFEMRRCIVAFNQGSNAVFCYPQLALEVSCSDVVPGDWTHCISGLGDVNGNFSADPLFCDPSAGDYELADLSPCLPGRHPGGADCGLIGAMDAGCSVSSVASSPPVESSWGFLKARLRIHGH